MFTTKKVPTRLVSVENDSHMVGEVNLLIDRTIFAYLRPEGVLVIAKYAAGGNTGLPSLDPEGNGYIKVEYE